MKKSPIQIVVCILLLSIFITPAMALNNQGLQWAISVDQRFNYTYFSERILENNTSSEKFNFYVIIDGIPDIPNNVGSLSEIFEKVNRTSYYENGTETVHPIIWYVLPVGNWSLIEYLWLSIEISESDIIDTDNLIGYNYTTVNSMETYIYSEIYVKTTGVLYRYYTSSIMSEYSRIVNITLTDDIETIASTAEANDIMFYLATGGAIVVIAVAIIVFIKLKK